MAKEIGVWPSTLIGWEMNHFTPRVLFVPGIVNFLGYEPFGPPPANFPEQLKAARIAAGFTRRQLAGKLGVHFQTLAKWERGEAFPLQRSLKRLEQMFPTVVWM